MWWYGFVEAMGFMVEVRWGVWVRGRSGFCGGGEVVRSVGFVETASLVVLVSGMGSQWRWVVVVADLRLEANLGN